MAQRLGKLVLGHCPDFAGLVVTHPQSLAVDTLDMPVAAISLEAGVLDHVLVRVDAASAMRRVIVAINGSPGFRRLALDRHFLDVLVPRTLEQLRRI